MNDSVIEFQNLAVVYPNGARALRGITFAVAAGECFALVGESGCGKTTLARAALGILPLKTKVSGSIRAGGIETTNAAPKFLRTLRGRLIGFVAQDPFAACQPLASVEDFVAEAWRVHSLLLPPHAVESSLDALGIERARERMRQFPHAWSGGMLQRAGIAAAAAHSPPLIIADEPTSALDADLNQAVLDALRKTATAVLLISHDLRLVEKYADRLAVIKNGEIVETGEARLIFNAPQHSYTKELLCAARPIRREKRTIPETAAVVLEAKNLGHFYGRVEDRNRIFENLNIQVREGEIVGIGGASGAGKSTLLRLLTTIETPRTGEILLSGELAASANAPRARGRRARNGFVMPIFQDSAASLDRRWAIWRIVTEPLTAKHRAPRFSRTARREIAREKLRAVNLDNVNLEARPTELSVGQCQRVAVARALTAAARLIAADEPTSSLDVLSGERVMRLFVEAAEKGAGIIIVSHNETLLKNFCHRVYRMRGGVLENAEN